MTFEVPHLDRDPKTGQLLPGHSVSNKAQKVIAQKIHELKMKYLEAMSPEDAKLVYEAHMECIRQQKDAKLRLAAVALWYDRNFGKAVQPIEVENIGEKSGPMLNINVLSPGEQAKFMEMLNLMSKKPEPLEVASKPLVTGLERPTAAEGSERSGAADVALGNRAVENVKSGNLEASGDKQ